jgi:4-amino-4-deoxy-L-arabinose transferase-like glycosyltransferase
MSTLSPAVALPPNRAELRRVAVIVGALTILRLIGLYFSQVDLFFDESQYWSWSRDLAFGYFSKPPLLAWVIAGAEHVCGSSEMCVRAPSPILHYGVSLAAFGIGHMLYDARTGFWAAMLTALGTGTVFSARIISTDVPLTFFWAVALLAYVHLCRRADWRWAVVLGVAFGAGLLAKYAMIYFVAGIVLAACVDKSSRAVLRTPQLWLAFAVALVTIMPNVLWNAANGFLTLRHAGNAVIGEEITPSVTRPLEFLAAQFGVFGPVVFGIALAAMLRISSPLLRSTDRMLLAFAITPLVVVTATASVVHAYANWAAASFVSLAVLAAAIMVRANWRFLLWLSVAIGVLAQIVLTGADAMATQVDILLPDQNPYYRTLGWNAFARTVGELARKQSAPTIVSDMRAHVASLLYYWRDQPEQILAWPTADLTSFELTRGLTASTALPILFVTECNATERIEKFYSKVTPLGFIFPEDPTPHPFFAFRVEDPRGDVGLIDSCTPP